MKQLISLKRLLFMVSILSAGIVYEACQKGENVNPGNNNSSFNSKIIRDSSNYNAGSGSVNCAGAPVEYSGWVTVKITGLFVTVDQVKEEAKREFRKKLIEQCRPISCGTQKTCGLAAAADPEIGMIAQSAGRPGEYGVQVSGSGTCGCK